jgi:anti-sigma regulatory factor (Ser/Thr protein kinase)
MGDEVRIPIESGTDLVPARAEGRMAAMRLGFSQTDATLIATAISEIARNIVVHAGRGEIRIGSLHEEHRKGLVVVAEDRGPGIGDLDLTAEGQGMRAGLGLGVPGARRLMDEFEVVSEPNRGTTVTMRKWRQRSALERLREGSGLR